MKSPADNYFIEKPVVFLVQNSSDCNWQKVLSSIKESYKVKEIEDDDGLMLIVKEGKTYEE